MADTDSPYQRTITDLVAKIEERLRPINDDKRMVNKLCEHAGIPLRYPDVDTEKTTASTNFRRDQFYGKPLATAIREYLEARGPSDRGGFGAATVNEIYDALSGGGFKFEAKDDLNAKRGLRVALTKNSVTFHRVPSGTTDAYGLLSWYPDAKAEKPEVENEKKGTAKPTKEAHAAAPKKKRGRPPKASKSSPVDETKTAADQEPAAA